MKIPKSYKNNSTIQKRIKLADPVAETDMAKRMVAALGVDDFQVIRTFQQVFGAKVVYYQDAQGEVGRKPEYVSDAG